MSKKTDALADSIRQQILSALDTGMWQRGDRLPSTRDMGTKLAVDARLVAHAYGDLAEEGLIELRPRSGVFISSSPIGFPGAPSGLSQQWLVQMLAETVRRETPVPGLAEWVRRATETVRLRAFVIAPLTDQVSGLVRELRVYYGLDATGATTTVVSGGDPPLALRQADLIVTVESAFELAAHVAKQVGAKVVCVSVRRDIVGPTLDGLMQSPTYLVVSDEYFGRVLANYLIEAGSGEARPVEPIRTLVVGRDDLNTIPDTAIVYVTQAAREVLGGGHVNGHVLPQVQVISRASSAEILNFIVGVNLGALRAREEMLQ